VLQTQSRDPCGPSTLVVVVGVLHEVRAQQRHHAGCRSLTPRSPRNGSRLVLQTFPTLYFASNIFSHLRITDVVCLQPAQYLDDPLLVPLEDDDYVAFGLACCFVMNDNLKLDGTLRCSACLVLIAVLHPILSRSAASMANPAGAANETE